MNNPTALVLLGITGDLSKKKILPSLYNLYSKELLPKSIKIIGFSRRDWSDDDLYEFISETIFGDKNNYKSDKHKSGFMDLFTYQKGIFEDSSGFKELATKIHTIETELNICLNKIFYLSVAPEHYSVILESLKQNKLTESCNGKDNWTRILIEKPFGKDLNTAEKLETELSELFTEDQIYRIDHYLGKEMVQNIIAFRFANILLESNWNSKSIEKVEIYVHEKMGIEGRTNFYDGVGALRDVGQNHLLQLLALITMEEPIGITPQEIRKRRSNVLNDLIIPTDDYIKQYTKRSQYNGYLNENGVNPNSKTETYFHITTFINNERWKGVPFTIESGKKMEESDKKVIVTFKEKYGRQNKVIMDLDGADMGISIEFWAKKPGFEMNLEKRIFNFSLCDDFETCNIAEPYEKLLLDAFEGNQTLFVSTQEIKAMWKFVDPIILGWEKEIVPLNKY